MNNQLQNEQSELPGHNGPHLTLFKIRIMRLVLQQQMHPEDKKNEPKGLYMFMSIDMEEASQHFWKVVKVARPSDFKIEINQVPYNKIYVQTGQNSYNIYEGQSHYSNRKKGAKQNVRKQDKLEHSTQMPTLQAWDIDDVQLSHYQEAHCLP